MSGVALITVIKIVNSLRTGSQSLLTVAFQFLAPEVPQQKCIYEF